MLSKISRSLVACNIYVSAGGNPNHRDVLLNLLTETQELCRLANNGENRNCDNNHVLPTFRFPTTACERVAVVHSFRDGPYNRSSFHLAGSPHLVAAVGSSLAVRAVEALLLFETTGAVDVYGEGCICDSRGVERGNIELNRKHHPTVGIVDHVSVLPLYEKKHSNNTTESGNDDNFDPDEEKDATGVTGYVAKAIGERLMSSGADVLYYGKAHPSGKELAAVRRDSTRFFKGDDNIENSSYTASAAASTQGEATGRPVINATVGQATVGAPHRFVENYNIRLKPGVSRRVARTLTESVRERSGRGLTSVEALTLSYGCDQYEVACNLLDPSLTSARDVEERMKDWEQQQRQHQRHHDASGGLVDTAYRVGTTVDMCMTALREVSTEEGEIAHNEKVFNRLEEYFLIP
mmetsp:Transcript_213/g.540  ORF Transcript_213/g.540 Transcript_213/m.540 type:complete len:408 (-) Transcript_213:167-1390(-)